MGRPCSSIASTTAAVVWQLWRAYPTWDSVASRLEPDKVRRLVAEVDGILARREELFRARGITRWPAHGPCASPAACLTSAAFPPGRGLLVRRKEQPLRVQVAWTPEPAGSADPMPSS